MPTFPAEPGTLATFARTGGRCPYQGCTIGSTRLQPWTGRRRTARAACRNAYPTVLFGRCSVVMAAARNV